MQTPPPDYSVDYLNQISGENNRRSAGPNKFVMLIAGAVGLIAIIAFAFMVLSGGTPPTEKAIDAYLRARTLESLANDNQKALRDNDLRSINSSFSLQLTNVLSEASTPMSALGIDVTKLDKARVEKEAAYQQSIQSEFDDAKLNVQLDSVYVREMTYQLETLRTMMQSAKKATSNSAYADFITSTDTELVQFEDKFSNFSAN